MASRTSVEVTSDAIWVRPPKSPFNFDLSDDKSASVNPNTIYIGSSPNGILTS